jgi:hypothetical protein
LDARSKGLVTRRAPGSGNAEGNESSREVRFLVGYGRHSTQGNAASEEDKTLKVAWKCKRGEAQGECIIALGAAKKLEP